MGGVLLPWGMAISGAAHCRPFGQAISRRDRFSDFAFYVQVAGVGMDPSSERPPPRAG